MLRFFYLIKYWAFLLTLGFSFGGCVKNQDDFFIMTDALLSDAEDIVCYITGQTNKVDDQGNIIGNEPSEKNFAKAHKSFQSLQQRLREYPKITHYPTPKSTLQHLQSILQPLKAVIDHLPDGGQKSQFSKEYKQVTEYIDSLMNEHLSKQ